MSKLNKTSHGLLFYDDFSEKTLMWTLSPSDSNNISFGDNGLRLSHCKNYVSYTLIEPELEEYSCIVHLQHTPVNKDDIAGILVMATKKEYAECQTFLATEPSELTNIENIINASDVQQYIDNILSDNNYVTWSLDDEENIDISDLPDLPSSPTTPSFSTSISTSSAKDNNFVDTLYNYIRFTKSKHKYDFWASNDMIKWIEVGNVRFDNAGVIGFFIYGTEDQNIIDNSDFYIKDFVLYSSKFIKFEGIDRKCEIEIFDKYGNIILRTDDIYYSHLINRSSKTILFNIGTSPIPIQNGTLRIYPKDDYSTTIGKFDLGEKTYGGDGFILERDIRLSINGNYINPSELYDLGTFYRGSYYIKVNITNYEDYILNDIKVKVLKYSEYYGGEEEVGICLYNEQADSQAMYQKSIIIDDLKPSESKTIMMKLTDKPIQSNYGVANSFRFKIMIE